MSSTSRNSFSFNYVDAKQTIALGIVLPAVCVAITAVRFWKKHVQKTGIGLDDWLTLFALVNIVGMGIALIYGAALGGIGHRWMSERLPGLTPAQQKVHVPSDTVIVLKVAYVFQILMVLACGSVKMSITLFYRQLFIIHRGTLFDFVTSITLVVTALWTLTFEFIMIFGCGTHISANWGPPPEMQKYCTAIGFSSEHGWVISDLIMDLIVILMPLPLLWNLHMSMGRKVAVTCVFLLGASALGASVARLVLFLEVVGASMRGIASDPNLNITVALYWSMLEAGLALIAACLPILSSIQIIQKLEASFDGLFCKVSAVSTKWRGPRLIKQVSPESSTTDINGIAEKGDDGSSSKNMAVGVTCVQVVDIGHNQV